MNWLQTVGLLNVGKVARPFVEERARLRKNESNAFSVETRCSCDGGSDQTTPESSAARTACSCDRRPRSPCAMHNERVYAAACDVVRAATTCARGADNRQTFHLNHPATRKCARMRRHVRHSARAMTAALRLLVAAVRAANNARKTCCKTKVVVDGRVVYARDERV